MDRWIRVGRCARTRNRKRPHGCWASVLVRAHAGQNVPDAVRRLTSGPRVTPDDGPVVDAAGRWAVDGDETRSANRSWWDGEAEDYYAEHGAFLGDSEFVWGPEGWTEAELDLLEVRDGMTVLEIGSGAAQCSRWLARHHDVRVVASDLSMGMLRTARRIEAASSAYRLPGIRAAPAAVRRAGAAAGGRERRPRLHGLRRGAVRRGQRRGAGRGGPGAAPGWPVRVLDVAPGAVGVPRRPGAERADRDDLVLRPHPLRRERRGRGDLRRAPPHHRRPGAAGRGGRAGARRPRRAGVAGPQRAGMGRLVAAARARCYRARRSWSPTVRPDLRKLGRSGTPTGRRAGRTFPGGTSAGAFLRGEEGTDVVRRRDRSHHHRHTGKAGPLALGPMALDGRHRARHRLDPRRPRGHHRRLDVGGAEAGRHRASASAAPTSAWPVRSTWPAPASGPCSSAR